MKNRLTTTIAITGIMLASGCIPAPAPTPPADTTAPTLAQVTAVPNGNDTTPDYTFSSNEAGTISYGGSCGSATTAAVSGNNTVSFSTLGYAVYSNCTLQVTDSAGNASNVLAVNSFRIVKPRPINDTGITLCGDMAYSYTGYTGSGTHNNNVVCATAGSTTTAAGSDSNGDAVPAGQDAVYGRDANGATNSDSDGHKGFSFTKLKADGTALAIQNGTWSDAGSEAAGTKWSCVQDNVTGMIWEVKTNDSGLRDKDWYYSWYNSTGVNDGGDHGIGDTGVGTTTGYETLAGTYAGSDNCANTSRCDTEKYAADVNTATLCGASDWRLPTADELLTLAANNRVNPAIDTAFIPNTITNFYWSSSPYAANNSSAWFVAFSVGNENYYGKNNNLYVRLVRGGSD